MVNKKLLEMDEIEYLRAVKPARDEFNKDIAAISSPTVSSYEYFMGRIRAWERYDKALNEL
jgi:hypothetical protein